MPTATTQYTFLLPNNKLEGPKKWLQRQLRKTASRHNLKHGESEHGLRRGASLKRPRSAPSIAAEPSSTTTATIPCVPSHTQQACHRHNIPPPLRPPPPDSGVMRDVSAWLDSSMSIPSTPLMGGVPYWRSAATTGFQDCAGVQYAVPISQESRSERPSTSHSQHVKSLRKCAKKTHVQMPSLLRTNSQRTTGRKEVKRLSSSMPVLTLPHIERSHTASPALLIASSTLLHPDMRPATASTLMRTEHLQVTSPHTLEQMHLRHGTPTDTRLLLGGSHEQCSNAVFGRSGWGAESTRPSTAAAGLHREDSMGDISDAPTYFTGPPPPSYRSRAASVLTTSSFGCVDGMSPTQRQISQQRAAQRRGMRGRLRKFTHRFVV